ncbi:MAG: tetratricopeptide repeat protein [Burkholderiales bacterium]|nr:tetratricopeptide repeat protein [Burkholderiales bacterium]
MAHFDLHEQEQLSNLKYFWQKGGRYIIGVVVVAIVAYIANVVWVSYKSNQAADAALIYTKFSAMQNNPKEMLNMTHELQSKYPHTEYSAMASLLMAKTVWTSGDLKTASGLLNWVIDNAKDKSLISTARLRLADVLIDQQQFDDALKQMQQPHDQAFDVLYYIKRGDLYVAKGNLNKARDAYREAQQKAGQDSGVAQEVQIRLDVLGG